MHPRLALLAARARCWLILDLPLTSDVPQKQLCSSYKEVKSEGIELCIKVWHFKPQGTNTSFYKGVDFSGGCLSLSGLLLYHSVTCPCISPDLLRSVLCPLQWTPYPPSSPSLPCYENSNDACTFFLLFYSNTSFFFFLISTFLFPQICLGPPSYTELKLSKPWSFSRWSHCTNSCRSSVPWDR